MKVRVHPTFNNLNILDNKENINPILNYTPNKPGMKKNAKENFFDEMDQLLNADFWQKNANRTNYPPKLIPSKNTNNILMTNNNISPNNPFGLKINSKGMNNLNTNFDSLMNAMNNFNNLTNNIGNNAKTMNLFKPSENMFNAPSDTNDNKNVISAVNQSNQENKLSTILPNKNNTNIFHRNKNVDQYPYKNTNITTNNNLNNKNILDLNNLSNLGTETKNRFSNKNISSIDLAKNNYNNSILQLTNPPQKEINANKIEPLEIINSYDMEEVFGSELNSVKSNPPSKLKKNIEDINFFKQPITVLMKLFPLKSIITFPSLNRVQEECFDLLFRSDERALITSPTGSGKTLLFELGIARIIKQNYSLLENNYKNKNFKIIYIAPIKSLCQEKTFEWKMKYGKTPLELTVTESTSDSEYLNINLLNNSNIILTTPEKFDVLTRKWKDISSFISKISLLLIDEIHLLNEEHRGATLEAIIARIKLLKNMENFKQTNLENIRIIAVSATIPNIKDVAEFLEINNNNNSKGLKIFGEEYRPVKVERIVIGYKRNKNQNEFVFEKYLDYRVSSIIEKYSEGKPTLIFCQTQKGSINSAKQLMTDYQEGKLMSMKLDPNTKKILEQISTSINNKQLSTFVKFGIAFHNAGLSLNDRQIIEDNFKINAIKIICTTSTLSQGVNLPARLVIIKSTNCYKGHNIGYSEYTKMEIDQMCGRAGRPQYDNKGIAVIMTESYKTQKFEGIGCEKIESHLKPNIVEHINAEIATGIINDMNTALIWIKNTFMYIRMIKEPSVYGIRPNFEKNINKVVDQYLCNLIQKTFKDLSESSLINIKIDKQVSPLKLCKKMSKNYVRFETMKIIDKMMKEQNGRCIVGNQVIQQIIDVLSKSEEFRNIRSKIEERKTLNELNKGPISEIRFKLKGAIDSGQKKAYLLIQSALSGKVLENWELRKQQNEICQTSERILNCIRQVYKDLDDCKGFILTILMSKSLDKGMWPDSVYIIKQLPRIGDKFSRLLYRGGYTSFEKLREETNPRVIENICGKNPPFGNIILDAAKSLPIINFEYKIDFYKDIYKIILEINCPWNKTSSYTYIKNDINEYFDSYSTFHIIAADSSGTNKILYNKKIRPSQKSFKLFINGIKEKQFPITIFFISDKFLGLDKILIIESKNDKKGEIFSLYNENLNNIINKINYCLDSKNDNKDGTKSKLSKSIMKELENPKVLEKEFDIKLNPSNTTPKSLHKSKSPTPVKKIRKKNNRKKHKKGEYSDSDLKIINNNDNNDMPELNKENKEIIENNINDKSQMKITNFTTDKKNIEENNKLHVSAIYGEDNINSGGNKMNELNKIQKSKKGKKVKVSTQNLINDLNNLDKNGNEYDFEFLNKFDKFDNETNSMFDLFTAPKKNKNNVSIDNIEYGNDLMNISKENKNGNNENNQKSDLGFLNAIEDLNKYL